MTPSANMTNLDPQTTREWLMHINGRFTKLEETMAGYREDITTSTDTTSAWIYCHERETVERDRKIAVGCEKVDQLEKRVNGWSIINSLGVAVAAIMAALGLSKS